MRTFPIFKLPLLAGINVIDKMNVEDIFVFSLASVRAKHLAIAARKRIDGMEWCFSSTENDIDEFEISLTRGVCLRIPMLMSPEEAGETGKLVEWKLNGQLIPMYRKCYSWYIGDRRGREHYYELMDMLSKHILEVFVCEDFELCTDLPNLTEDLFVYKHTRQFNELEYSGCEPMPADHLKFVLEQLEVYLSLKVFHEVPDFRWSGPLNMTQLIVYDAKWVTFEALMNNICGELHLYEHVFTGVELNTFLKKWLAGGFPNLEYCTFDSDMEYSIDEVLQGIETMSSNQANHPENQAKHPGHAIYNDDSDYEDLSDGVDIRSNTGVLATIDVDSYGFAMAVWNNV